ncbi:uncharacterized protein LOC144432738 [Glandiceps talaboti]
MERKMDKKQGQMRSDNLIFRGLEEDVDETWDDTENKLKSFISDNLDLNGDEIEFERAHRLNNAKSNPKPIIAKFSKYKHLEQVLKASAKLKNTEYKIYENFSSMFRKKRRKIGPFLMNARTEGKNAHLEYDKLKVDNVIYVYDNIKKTRQTDQPNIGRRPKPEK